MTPLRLIFAGAGEFGALTLTALLDAGHDVVQVVSQPDRPAGRGRALTPTAISKIALERNLPLLRTTNINAESMPPADAMVVIAFGQKIAPHVVDHPRLGSANLHSSLLPKYRGAAPINAAVLNGDRVSGNSVIRLAEKMDAGDILGQSELAIGDSETAGELHDRLAIDGGPLMLRVLDELSRGIAVETPQDHAQATIAPKLTRESTRLDFPRSAVEIANQIRGLYPWPGCRVRLSGQDGSIARLTLVRAKPAAGAGGTAGAIDVNGHIATSDGSVEILEVQPEGKRPMPLQAYRNGHPWTAGMHIESLL